MKVLLSVYACEPGKGSEPGVGWKWVVGLSQRVELTVVTRLNNRESIEKEINTLGKEDPLHKVKFVYHDLSPFFRKLKKLRVIGTLPYYFLWQYSLASEYTDLADEQDIVHHLTFCTLLCPGFWRLKKASFVVGPVGAPLVNRHYYSLFGVKSLGQRLRGMVMKHFLSLPWLKRSLKNAAAVFPANSETQALLESHGINTQAVMLDTGTPVHSLVKNYHRLSHSEKPCGFIYAGRIEKRKGLELVIRAFALADQEGCKNWSFSLLGDGPDSGRLRKLADELEISDRVRFLDPVPHSEVLNYFYESDVFVFTSVRDTSGGVNLEAMVAGLPILCISHQGVGDITDDSCALRIKPGSILETIRSLADGIKMMIDEPARRAEMGVAAQQRATSNFSWDEKFNEMLKIYETIARV
jgi:glycosyltransferase involved in cell wall biosynthesis